MDRRAGFEGSNVGLLFYIQGVSRLHRNIWRKIGAWLEMLYYYRLLKRGYYGGDRDHYTFVVNEVMNRKVRFDKIVYVHERLFNDRSTSVS